MPKVKWLKHDEAEITVSWRRWFGLLPPEVVTYRGSATVWHDAKTGKRQPTHIELRLCDMWTKAKWDREQAAEVSVAKSSDTVIDGNYRPAPDARHACSVPVLKQETTMPTQVYIRATGTPSDGEDENVAGFYMVEIDGDVPSEHIGSAALDVFHSDVAVEVLDDFEFTVFDMDGKIVEISDSDDYEFTDRGTAYTIPEPEGVDFEERQTRAAVPS